MFGIFKKKSQLDKLQEQYRKLLEESYKLSTTNRSESDKKQAEAQSILQQIEILKQ
ncbi:Lacal_2735 family protein [Olleya sp. YS]|uniref:Lacal_2735 family protein n=1 Tax=Olleya sp. YS TaxID=3028318 RepID=UPI0024343313|nr:Lacal_2735 family protein [Olleya sp. YS]WGD34334.1 Lacal_2735 family protein [Olleya sp. YS]